LVYQKIKGKSHRCRWDAKVVGGTKNEGEIGGFRPRGFSAFIQKKAQSGKEKKREPRRGGMARRRSEDRINNRNKKESGWVRGTRTDEEGAKRDARRYSVCRRREALQVNGPTARGAKLRCETRKVEKAQSDKTNETTVVPGSRRKKTNGKKERRWVKGLRDQRPPKRPHQRGKRQNS